MSWSAIPALLALAILSVLVFFNYQWINGVIYGNQIAVNQVQISDLTLDQTPPVYFLSGNVQNNSTLALARVYLDVKALDCPTEAITPDCKTIGDDGNVTIPLNVAPHDTGRFDHSVRVDFGTLPPVQGVFQWSYTVTGVQAG